MHVAGLQETEGESRLCKQLTPRRHQWEFTPPTPPSPWKGHQVVVVPLLDQGYQGSPLVPGLGAVRDSERLVVGRGRGDRPGLARTTTRQREVVSPTAEGQVRGRNA